MPPVATASSRSIERLPIARGSGGCTFAEDPAIPASTARLLWRGDRDPTVLTARAEHVAPDDPDAILLETLPGWATLVDAGPRQHLVLADGVRRLRVDIEGSLTDGPVRLHYELAGIHGVETKLHTLKRLLAALRLGRFARGLELVPPRADRLGMMLRAHDLAAAGASHRAIAVELFGAERVSNEWRTSSDSLRLRVQRLCRDAAKMVDGGYLALLADGGG